MALTASATYRGLLKLGPPPGTLVGDKNTTFVPVQDAINLFWYTEICIYMQGYIFPYIAGRSSPNKYINKNFWGGSGQDKSIPKFQGGALI